MKIESPPAIDQYDFDLYLSKSNDEDVLGFIEDVNKRYMYWSELKYRPNLPFSDAKEAWSFVRTSRFLASKRLVLGQHHFSYYLTSFIQQDLHLFDLKLMGGLYKDAISKEDQIEYFKTSLIEEAIASSQIEGAATTTDVAREMIKSSRKPRTESEQMIMNNYRAISEIDSRLDEELSLSLILDLHQIMTANTEANKYAGKIRDHIIYVKDHVDGEISYTAPSHEQVLELLNGLIDFVNTEEEFVHPIIKASILHFMIGYIHPFGDGNGRTARALFYWFMMKKGYSLLKHISISRAILDSRSSYDRAFLRTEHDDNDLTYFIMYSMKSLRIAFQSLVNYRDRKREERNKQAIISSMFLKLGFNKRQSDLLGYLYVKPKAEITIPFYAQKHDIVRQTAERDIKHLERKAFLQRHKDGKYWIYSLVSKRTLENLVESVAL